MVAGGRKNNKSTIPGSLASLGLIPGTTHKVVLLGYTKRF
jgi:hypothetical protein